jgi:lambda family phage portal protein
MNLLERMFPAWAVKRRTNLQTLQRLLEHDKTSNRHPRRKMGPHSGDAVMQHTRHKIRESARWLEENHAAAVSILEVLVTNIIGDGTIVEPMVKTKGGELATDTNEALRRAWRDWMQSPEVTRDYAGCEFEAQIVRSWLRDGEVFGQHVTRGAAYRWPTDLQYAVELIESDLVPFEHNEQPGFTHGVRKDTWGGPIQYLVLLEHPGSATVRRGARIGETKVVAAETMFHLKWTTRVRQTRGISILHAVIDTLLDLADYEDAERVAARVNAAQVIAIKSGYAPPETATSASGEREYKVGPASIWHLQPGEDVTAIRADRPNPNLDPFVSSQLRRVAGGTLTSYSSVSRDYNGTYSAQRQELVETQRFYKRLQRQYYDEALRQFYRFVIQEALRVRQVPVKDIDETSLFDVDMRGPGLIWIDPQKEANAAETDINIGIRSRQQIIRERGGDPEQVTKELETDEFERKDLAVAGGRKPAGDERNPNADAGADAGDRRAA